MNILPSAPHWVGGRIKEGKRDKAPSMEPGELGPKTQEILVVTSMLLPGQSSIWSIPLELPIKNGLDSTIESNSCIPGLGIA